MGTLLVYFSSSRNIYYVWRNLLKDKRSKKRVIISLLIASLGWLLPLNTMLLGLEDIHNMVIYFVMGMIFCYFHLEQRNEKVFFRILIMFLTLMIANVLMNYCEYNSRCVKMFEAVCWIEACWEVAFLIRKSKLATWISNHNFTIYIYSWLFQSVFILLCDRMGVIWLVFRDDDNVFSRNIGTCMYY